MKPMTKFLLYTDGSSTGRVGEGGWGFIVSIEDGEVYSSFGSENQTTNNRMELQAVIEGLRWCFINLKHHDSLEVYSDSQYVVNGATSWRESFEKKINIPNKLLNSDLWTELYNLIDQFETIDFKWLRGHSGNKLNEKADSLAKKGKLLAKSNDSRDLRKDT